ncbi:MAG: hypothetical protein QOJ65_1045 [Fimbriimonadaceae bacterium]|jgi:uncharacterized membrane protein YkvA (DUF1232 family)|nr:hypothetical protein [Fimbriimonadaceae bacterium]
MRFIGFAKTLARYWRMTQDRRTPAAVRWLIYGGIAFTLIPDDWLPDWIPGLGLIDDAAVLPSVIAVSMLLIPEEVRREHDAKERMELAEGKIDGQVQAHQAALEDRQHKFERAASMA